MPTLFIIDQSLKEMGGHHFDYVRLVAHAATQLGIDPVIGTNRGLRADAEMELNKLAQVEKGFRETTYTPLSHLAGLTELVRGKTEPVQRRPEHSRGFVHNLLAKRARRRRMSGRARLIRKFAEDCEDFFGRFTLEETDHVFFTTMSEIEFMGLTAFLGNHPESIAATWHSQFHFSMFSDRPDEFSKQSRTANLLTGAFQSALSRAPYHEIRAYTTSDELADQYNHMELLRFQSLPYPVNPQLFANLHEQNTNFHAQESVGPLNIAVAGGVRREKGQKTRVNKLINAIWESQIATGNVRIDIQSGNPKTFSAKRTMPGRRVNSAQYRKMVRIHNHPLPESEYVDLVQNADVGLFCYDSCRYYSRRAGILSEFLASGKPVIVPAGCWLSRQISESTCRHIDSLVAKTEIQQTLDITDLSWDTSNVPLAGRAISFNKSRNPFLCQFRKNDLVVQRPGGLAIDFRWQWAAHATSFVEIELTCFDEQDRMIGFDKQIVGVRTNQPESLAFLRLPERFASAKLAFRNAYSDSSITIADVKARFLNFGDQPQPPRSAVGIIAADDTMLAHAVDEMVDHYDHYLESAERFSRLWAAWHDPVRTVETLVPISGKIRHAA